jgi:hypothetical protein
MLKNLLACLLSILITATYCAQAQDTTVHNSVEVTPLYGLKMFSSEHHQLKGDLYGAEVGYHISMQNNKADWIRLLHVQDIGIIAYYRNMDNIYLDGLANSRGILGKIYGVESRLDISLLKSGKTQLFFIPGFGFLYATEDYLTNQNILVGSHLNFNAQAGFRLTQQITPTTKLQVGIDLFHYSNAGVRIPNNGINAINASVGAIQSIDATGLASTPHEASTFRRSSFEFGADVGVRGVINDTTNKAQPYGPVKSYIKTGFYFGYNYRVSPVLSLKLGSEYIWYQKTYDKNDFYGTYQFTATSYDKWRYGVSLGGDLWMGKLAMQANYGYYLHFKSYTESTFGPIKTYWTIGLKYYVLPWMALQAKQYLNRTEADYVGFGVIFRLHT